MDAENRLTIRLPSGVIKRSDVMGESVMQRLTAYEDTGLTPDEVTAMIAENTRLRAELEAAKRDMRFTRTCLNCVHRPPDYHALHGACRDCDDEDRWQWRGLCAENGGAK